jgi:hypothetical protein
VPCKVDGITIAEHLDAIRTSNATERDLTAIRQKLQTVTRGARCFLAQQQERVVTSVLALFPEAFAEHIAGHRPSATCELLAPIVDIVGGQTVLDTGHRHKQPDWTYGPRDSGSFPADLYTNEPLHIRAAAVTEMPLSADDAAGLPAGLHDDPFAEITIGHRRVLESIDEIRGAGRQWPSLEPLLHELRHHLQVHDDITNGVLYPMLARAAGEDGEDAAFEPREEIRAALHLVERILRRRSAPTPDELDEIANLAHRHNDAGEREVLPMIRERLDGTHLDKLRDALATAMKWRTP